MTMFAMNPSTVLLLCAALAATGCATTADTSLAVGNEASVEGAVVSIDTQPWTYDGNAVIQIDSRAHGAVVVQLPARWNLCQAPAVDVAALHVGMRVRVVGQVSDDNTLVVCQQASHRLVPSD